MTATDTPLSVSPPAPRPLPPDAAPAPAPSVELRAVAALLRMADTYRDRGAVRQAASAYFDILARYGHLPEAAPARDRLLAFADAHQARGEFRQAKAIYDRLL